MPDSSFKLLIGAKRQVTVPSQMMQILDLQEGDEVLCKVNPDQATLTPIVSIARTDLPESLRRQFLKRRGSKAKDLTADEFLSVLADETPESWHQQRPAQGSMRQLQQQAAQRAAHAERPAGQRQPPKKKQQPENLLETEA